MNSETIITRDEAVAIMFTRGDIKQSALRIEELLKDDGDEEEEEETD